MNLSRQNKGCLAVLAGALTLQSASGTERIFTYSYEPETMPQGAMEFEQWVTLRTQRNKAVGQRNFNRWELREEFEYGVSDNYTLSLYLNYGAESFRDLEGMNRSSSRFDGISLENRYLVLNPAEHKLGLALYLEPRFAGDEAEVEQRLILGQRHGDWKWALNLTHATEWADNLHKTEGEVEASIGVARQLGKHWSFGLEARDHNEIPDYRTWENTAVFAGPVVSYRQERWWATLTVMPQIWGRNFSGNPDQDRWLELEGHERVNLRLIFGVSF